jgi:hypothetical protein
MRVIIKKINEYKGYQNIFLSTEEGCMCSEVIKLDEQELKQVRNTINDYLRTQSTPNTRNEAETILAGVSERFNDKFGTNPRIGALQQGDIDRIKEFIKDEIIMDKKPIEENEQYKKLLLKYNTVMKTAHSLNNVIRKMEKKK